MKHPYRESIAPSIEPKWDGSHAAGVVYVGSPTDLVVASNGKVYDRRTGELVQMLALKNLEKNKENGK